MVFAVTDDQGNELGAIQCATNQAASLTWTYSALANWRGAEVLTGTRVAMALPVPWDVPLRTGYTLKTAIVNKQAGDALTVAVSVVQRAVVPGWQM